MQNNESREQARKEVVEKWAKRAEQGPVKGLGGVSGGRFDSLGNRARVVFGVFAIFAGITVFAIISYFTVIQLLGKPVWQITMDEILAMDARLSLLDTLFLWTAIVAGIVFLVWVYRANKNLSSLGAGGTRFTPGWAVGWFFVPFMNLVRPYQVVKEIFEESDPGIDVAGTVKRGYSSSTIVGWWWALFLGSSFAEATVYRLIDGSQDVSELVSFLYVAIGVKVLNIAGMIVTVLMVKKISDFQERKSELVSLQQEV